MADTSLCKYTNISFCFHAQASSSSLMQEDALVHTPTSERPPRNAIFRQADAPVEERIADLLSRMTLEEKIGQLLQDPMNGYGERKKTVDKGLRKGRWGSRILATSAWAGGEAQSNITSEELNEMQRVCVEESRLGIPLLFGRDVIHGQATVLPIPLAQAASFDLDLIETANTDVARESALLGVHWAFAPMIDLCRDPRWGRIIESYGEDPYLVSQCGAAVIRGFQGNNLSDKKHLAACAKHFCGYGGAEGGRDYDSAEWSGDSLHNLILPPFREAVRTGVCTVMSAFHSIGGMPASANFPLMQKWLKETLGFDGFVVSDWGAIRDLVSHGLARDDEDAAAAGIHAGIDMEMVSEIWETQLCALVKLGRICGERLDDAVRRVLRIKFRLGLFEKPYAEFSMAANVLRCPEHVKRATQLARESMVLLKNDQGLLPLRKSDLKVAVVGPYAEARRQLLGAWCLDGRPDDVVTITQGIAQVAPGVNIVRAHDAFADEILIASANADVVILCVGESDLRNGEAHNIADLSLPPGQEAVIEAVGRLRKPLVVVQCTGRPIPSPAAEKWAQSWLLAWQGGTEAGTAIAEILFGVFSPSGKLPVTLPRHTGQIPIYYNRRKAGKLRQYNAYHFYQDLPDGPLFPFGYGMGYSRVEYGPTTVKPPQSGTRRFIATTTVTNLGSTAMTEVVQCYIQDVTASLTRPERELKGFRRIHLQAGERKEISFDLGPESLGFHDMNNCFRVEPGLFRAGIGSDSTVPLSAEFTVDTAFARYAAYLLEKSPSC